MTIILTTHYLKEAENLCDQIAVINSGKVIACDKKRNLLKILDEKLHIEFSEKMNKSYQILLKNYALKKLIKK